MKTTSFYLVLLSLFVMSCQSETNITLNHAESILEQRPDSALVLLENLPRRELRRKGLMARYSLLKSAALNKSYIDVDSDSLSHLAVDYYSGRNNKYEMLAWYYHALTQINAHSYTSSIVALEEAERIARMLDDPFQLGLILRNKAKLFKLTNNNPSAIECRKLAIECFEAADKPKYKAFSELDLAIDYVNNRDFDKADSLLSKIRNSYNEPVIQNYCNIHQAGILVENDRMPELAISLYKDTPLKHYSLLDYGYLATSFESIHQQDSSDCWFAKGYALCKSEADSAAIDYMKSRVEANRGNFKTAFQLVDHASSVQDSLTRMSLQQSLSAAQRDYYKSETNLREERIRTMRQRTTFFILLGLIVLLSMAMMSFYWVKEKDQCLRDEMAHVALKERELESVNKDNAHLIGSLFSEKIDRFDQLCETYFKTEDGKQKELVLKQVKELAAKIRNDEGLFISLEKDLNRYCHEIMAKLREQVPGIKGENIKIISLFFAGFSYETIQIILRKNSTQSLRTMRSRFRKEIQDSNATDSEFFLKMLDIKKRPQAG